MNPLPKDKPLTVHRLLKLVVQVLECVKAEGNGHIPEVVARGSNAIVIRFDDHSEFVVSVINQSDLH